MTTTPNHHEPLDAEERDLAARLGRLGPLDGPPPALDAKILAAAHAAAATRVPNRRRRLAWLGVPPAVVTGMGVAAAAVLALGLVWQLRPQYSGIAAHGEAAGEEEIILIAPPADSAQAPAAAMSPPLADQPASPEPMASARSAPRVAEVPASPAASKATASAPAPASPAVSGELAADAAPAEARREADAAAGVAASQDEFVAEPPAASARKSHATYTTAARAIAEQRGRSAASTATAAPAAAPAAPAENEESTTLDRIEVTGSRIRDIDWSQVPVNDDTHLGTVEWLERIRARRDAGDTDNARASLKLFQREYPRVRLPDDLRALLADVRR